MPHFQKLILQSLFWYNFCNGWSYTVCLFKHCPLACVAWEQALPWRSGGEAKKERKLTVMSLEFEFHLQCPLWLPVNEQSSQFWPISVGRKWALIVNKHRNSAQKMNFPRLKEALKVWLQQKRSTEERCFRRQCFRPQHWDNKIFCKLCGVHWTQSIVSAKVFRNEDVQKN